MYSDAAQRAVESGNRNIVDIFSIHSANNDTGNFSVITKAACIYICLCDCCISKIDPVTNTSAGITYHTVGDNSPESSTKRGKEKKKATVFDTWKQQFVDAITVRIFNVPPCAFRFFCTIPPCGLLDHYQHKFLNLFLFQLLNQTVGNIRIQES